MGMGEFKDLFKPYGECRDAHVIKEKGIGFITLVRSAGILCEKLQLYSEGGGGGI